MVEDDVQTKDLFEAFILAGGVSSRMGRAKHRLDFSGEQLILRTIHVVEPLVKRVTVVGAAEGSWPADVQAVLDGNFGVREETGRSKGPLIGIATALSHSESPWNLILACDLPYLSRDWLCWLLARAQKSQSEIVVPKTTHGLEPLAAVYRRECAKPTAQLLLNGLHRATDALSQFVIETVDEAEWREIDPKGHVLKNMNTPADYEEAQDWFREKNSHA
jgi:molybdopterin-guanine dinucleotide biosynthesis protein A